MHNMHDRWCWGLQMPCVPDKLSLVTNTAWARAALVPAHLPQKLHVYTNIDVAPTGHFPTKTFRH